MLALTQLGEDAGLLTKLFKTSDGTFNRFVFSDSNTCHGLNHPQSHRYVCGTTIVAQLRSKSSNSPGNPPVCLLFVRAAKELHKRLGTCFNGAGRLAFKEVRKFFRVIGHDPLYTQRSKLSDLAHGIDSPDHDVNPRFPRLTEQIGSSEFLLHMNRRSVEF